MGVGGGEGVLVFVLIATNISLFAGDGCLAKLRIKIGQIERVCPDYDTEFTNFGGAGKEAL